jgi:H+-translocating NAD(P) transhydrogenase subunit alpha
MFSSNLTSFLKLLVKDGQIVLNREDEIIRETLVTHEGSIVHPRVAELASVKA